jgi:transcriptional regulator of acetoin/glycerol metabolism
LRDSERQTVVRVLAECQGNVSKAARSLGVSRGLVYRHLRQGN